CEEETGNTAIGLVRPSPVAAVLPAVTLGCSGRTAREVRVIQQSVTFGEELRRRRLAVGFTLTDLSRRVHYSKGQLSKVERGLKPPSRELVRLCDAVLDAG